MQTFKKIVSIWFLILLPFCSSFAVSIANLYQIDVPVATQDAAEREKAVQTGFIQILIKLTGDPDIKNNPALKSSIEKPEFYMQEYSYLPNDAGEGYKLQVKYEAKSINRLLKRNDISFWNDNRPLVLVWLSYQDQDKPQEMIGNENSGPVLDSFVKEGRSFGLPLMFPMMDITDLDQINNDSLIKMSNSAFQSASKRYSPNAILVGEIIGRDGSLFSDWKLILGEKEWTWSIRREKMDELSNEIIYQVSQVLSKHYVAKNPESEQMQVTLEVNGITEKDDLANLMKYLKKLSPVQEVELLGLSGDVVQLNVLYHGSLESFQENAAIGKRLNLKSHDLESNKLYYEWTH